MDLSVPPAGPVSIDTFRAAVKRRWRLVLTTAAVVTFLAALVAILMPKQYRVSAIAGVTASGEHMDAGDLYRGVEVLQQRTIVATVAALASIDETKRAALAAVPGADASYDVSAVVLPNTNLLRVDVQGNDPVIAARIANQIPIILSAQTRTMYKLYGVSTVSEAKTPGTLVSPNVARSAIAGAIFGLLLGAGAAFAKSLRRQEAARLTDAVPAT